MAVIGSIRKRGKLVAIVIGVSLLLFILTLGPFQKIFEGDNTTVANIDGDKINIQQYDAMYQNKLAQVSIMNQGQNLTDEQTEQIKDEVWNDLLKQKVFFKAFAKQGIVVTDEEINDMLVGETVHPAILQQFTNPQTGMFDPNQVANYSAQFDQTPDFGEGEEAQQKKVQFEASKVQWGYFQRSIKDDRLQTKYLNMVSKAMYVTNKEAETYYNEQNTKANVRFVNLPYASIVDSTIAIDENELIEWFKEHKYRMRSKKSKSIKYGIFAAIPTSEDSLALKMSIDSLKAEFASYENDTDFVAQNSDVMMIPTFMKKGSASPEVDSSLFNAPNGTTFGPYVENGYYIIAKKSASRMIPDSVKASHILLQPKKQEDVERLSTLRDSLVIALKAGANFSELAAKYSEDQSNKDKGGALNWFTSDMMVKEFSDSAFAAKKGQIVTANTQFGFHIILVEDISAMHSEAMYAVVSKLIEPSKETSDLAYGAANAMAGGKGTDEKANNVKYMNDYAKKNNVIYREEPMVTENTKMIGGFEKTKDLVKWVLAGKKNDVSDVYVTGNNYLVAVISSDRPEGVPNLEDVREEAEAAFRKHKKALKFIEDFNKVTASNKTVDAIAAALKTQVYSSTDLSFASFFVPAAGIEPALLGTVFGLNKTGVLSKPIEGNSGVYVVIVDQLAAAPKLPDYTMVKLEAGRMNAQKAAGALEAMKEKANIKDLRYKFDIF